MATISLKNNNTVYEVMIMRNLTTKDRLEQWKQPMESEPSLKDLKLNKICINSS